MIINKTPHEVKIALADSREIVIPPTAPAVRVSSHLVEHEPIDGIPFAETVFGAVENLPAYQQHHFGNCTFFNDDGECSCPDQPARYYIVSQIVIAACPERTDLVRPDTGPDAIRDADGRIVAVRRLTR